MARPRWPFRSCSHGSQHALHSRAVRAFIPANTVTHRGRTCCPHGCPGPSDSNATQPIKEIWAGCSGRANTHSHAALPLSPWRMRIYEHTKSNSICLYYPPSPPSPSFPCTLALHLPTAELTKSNYTCLITSRTIKTAVGGREGPV